MLNIKLNIYAYMRKLDVFLFYYRLITRTFNTRLIEFFEFLQTNLHNNKCMNLICAAYT
jgi:type II restriction/modification system DNA methylase subunit YeeA